MPHAPPGEHAPLAPLRGTRCPRRRAAPGTVVTTAEAPWAASADVADTLGAVVVADAQLAVVHAPPFHGVFATEALAPVEAGVLLAVTVVVTAVQSVAARVRRARGSQHVPSSRGGAP